jgi:hypothetical protein
MTPCNTSERLNSAFRLPVTHVWGRDCMPVTRFAPQRHDRFCWHLPYNIAEMRKSIIHVALISCTLCTFSLFWKNKSRFMRSQCPLCMPEPIFMKFGFYIMAPEPIPAVYVVIPTNHSAWLYAYPPIVARQRLSKNAIAATNTHATIEELLNTYSMRSVSYEREAGD